MLGEVHPSVTLSMNNVANLLARQLSRPEEAEALARQALAGDRKTFGEEHSHVAASLANLGVILRLEGKFAEADSMLRHALAINRKVFGGHHERIAGNLSALGLTRSAMGDDHRNTAATVGNLALVLADYGDPVEAESLARVSLAGLDSAKSEHRTYWIGSRLTLGKSLVAQRRAREALALLARLVETTENSRSEAARLAYGTALAAEGRYAEARPLLRAAQAALEKGRVSNPALAARADAAVQRLPR